ncbi:biotin transport system substrate-specific component [Haladaptatus litoreus]|uniref:Biotin transport system substrate-specific component n=1 Tax=Haladaptatus litoreus TaxID=553468 RepID=A0A1N7BR48_9EURY|nr:biotin transporter BioY [Haladaptatus litoreus]SIR53808.1 biotin transport system substrate-specific component [Haladaptatus litoreus]
MSTETGSVELVGEQTVGNIARTALFAAVIGAFAQVSFPNPLAPAIPVTLQVLGVFLAGIFLGPLWGSASMVLYLVAGSVGAPIFANGSAGFAELVGLTGGYLLSYPLAAFVIGVIVHGGLTLRDPKQAGVVRLVAGMVAGTAIIYAFGTVGFSYFGNYGLAEAFTLSAVAFVPFEAFKIAAAVGIVRSDRVTAE